MPQAPPLPAESRIPAVRDALRRCELPVTGRLRWPDLTRVPPLAAYLDSCGFSDAEYERFERHVEDFEAAWIDAHAAIEEDPQRFLESIHLPLDAPTDHDPSPLDTVYRSADAMVDAVRRRSCGAVATRSEVDEVIDTFGERFKVEARRELQVRARSAAEKPDTVDEPARPLAERLARDGYCPLRLDASDVDAVRDIVEPHVERLLTSEPSRQGYGYDRAHFLDREADAPAYRAIRRVLTDSGVLAAAQAYMGFELVLFPAVLHLSLPGDRHLRQTLGDTDFAPRTLNLHFDPKDGIAKAIFYLETVGEKDGPFTYVPGSHRWSSRPADRLAAKTHAVTNYLDTPARREAFMRFPTDLRRNAILGTLAADDTDLSRDLLARETPVLSGRDGDIVLFDPGGLHRGGNCTGGRRVSLQLLLRPARDGKPEKF